MNTMGDEQMSHGGRADIEMANFIKAEIKTAVEDHIQGTLNAPPSYDSSKGNPPSPQPIWKIVPQLVAVLFPVLAIILLVPGILISGTDPLQFSVLALLLFIFFFMYLIVIGIIVVCDCVLYFKSCPPLILKT
jgi:hypothetical protein